MVTAIDTKNASNSSGISPSAVVDAAMNTGRNLLTPESTIASINALPPFDCRLISSINTIAFLISIPIKLRKLGAVSLLRLVETEPFNCCVWGYWLPIAIPSYARASRIRSPVICQLEILLKRFLHQLVENRVIEYSPPAVQFDGITADGGIVIRLVFYLRELRFDKIRAELGTAELKQAYRENCQQALIF